MAGGSVRLSRRGMLRGAGVGAVVGVLATQRLPVAWAAAAGAAGVFTLGVASGDPLPDGVVLWTRLAPDPLHGGGMPQRAVPVEWELAADEGFGRVLHRGVEQARPELGHSVHVEVEGLEEGSKEVAEQAARPSPSKEEDRAAHPAQSGTRPGTDATPARPAAPRADERGDQPAGRPDRQSRRPHSHRGRR